MSAMLLCVTSLPVGQEVANSRWTLDESVSGLDELLPRLADSKVF